MNPIRYVTRLLAFARNARFSSTSTTSTKEAASMPPCRPLVAGRFRQST
uniref:Uncharacterized protein n=1 Tax=Arundo donax TaxID=35708 RepID=A0A0A9CWV7_ARUDO